MFLSVSRPARASAAAFKLDHYRGPGARVSEAATGSRRRCLRSGGRRGRDERAQLAQHIGIAAVEGQRLEAGDGLGQPDVALRRRCLNAKNLRK